MTGHIAALIEEWREAEAMVRKEAAVWRQHHKLALEAECLREARTIETHVCQLEAARDADCAEWRRQQTELGCSLEVEQCIRDLGGKP